MMYTILYTDCRGGHTTNIGTVSGYKYYYSTEEEALKIAKCFVQHHPSQVAYTAKLITVTEVDSIVTKQIDENEN